MFKPLKSHFLRILNKITKLTVKKINYILTKKPNKKTLIKYENLINEQIINIKKQLKGALHYKIVKKNDRIYTVSIKILNNLTTLLEQILKKYKDLNKEKKQQNVMKK